MFTNRAFSKHVQTVRQRSGTGASTYEYAPRKTTLTVCELIFKMARFEFPLTASHFSATFLDFQRNSRGYEEQFDPADLDATKRLLSPFLPKVAVSIPQCHRFGNAMWSFAKECAAVQCPSRTQGTGFKPPSCHLSSEEDLKNTPSRTEEPSRSSVFSHFASKNEPIKCAAYKIPEQRDLEDTGPLRNDFTNTAGFPGATNIKATSNGADRNQNTVVSKVSSSQNEDHHFPDCLGRQTSCEELCEVSSKLTSTGAVSVSDGDMKSSLSENHIFEQANLESSAKLSTNTHLQLGFENRASIGGDVESRQNNLFSGDGKCLKNAKNVKTEESVASKPLCASDVEFKDISNGPHLHDGLISEKQKTLTESIHKEHPITPLPLYKQRNYNSTPISTCLTVNLNLDALLSVLDSKQNNTENAEYDNVDICGKVAILYGFQQNATVSVLQTEMVGLYDYTLGTVCGLQQEFGHDESESQVRRMCLVFNILLRAKFFT